MSTTPVEPVEGELVPDTEEPWLPVLLNPTVLVPASLGAAAAACLAWLLGGHDGFLAATVLVLAASLVFLAVIDALTMRLPDPIVLTLYPVMAAGLALAATTGQIPWSALGRGLLWMAGAFILWWLVAFLTGGLGFGDVKLGGVLGLVLGTLGHYEVILGAFLLPPVLGGFAALPMFFMGQKDKAIPFGPYLAAGALIILIAGTHVVPLVRGY